ncbi:2Fe-2S iron-sulfur cluster-binding protein [Streptomyces sp. NPDC002164]|uniref:2Fe-2S iron-sulfur cluster-binding protein n=1 Tax=Streptomyces sp. NPDC002164 TaxID=3364633 RepID=UPI0036A2FC0B
MSNEDRNKQHEQYGQGEQYQQGEQYGQGEQPRPTSQHGGWQPTPQGGEFDTEATAFVHLSPEDLANIPLAAPGHGYVPPMIVPLTPAAGFDPATTQNWVAQPQSRQEQAPSTEQPAPTAPDAVHWPDPNQQQASYGYGYPQTPPYEDPAATGQWNFHEAADAESAGNVEPGGHGGHAGSVGHVEPGGYAGHVDHTGHVPLTGHVDHVDHVGHVDHAGRTGHTDLSGYDGYTGYDAYGGAPGQGAQAAPASHGDPATHADHNSHTGYTPHHTDHTPHHTEHVEHPGHNGQTDSGVQPGLSDHSTDHTDHTSHTDHTGQTGHVGGSGHTGQWTIPVAEGDLPEESGEFAASALASQWYADRTPPATLPGGAPAPWAAQHPVAEPEQGPAAEADTRAPHQPEPRTDVQTDPHAEREPAAGPATESAHASEPEPVPAPVPGTPVPAASAPGEAVEPGERTSESAAAPATEPTAPDPTATSPGASAAAHSDAAPVAYEDTPRTAEAAREMSAEGGSGPGAAAGTSLVTDPDPASIPAASDAPVPGAHPAQAAALGDDADIEPGAGAGPGAERVAEADLPLSDAASGVPTDTASPNMASPETPPDNSASVSPSPDARPADARLAEVAIEMEATGADSAEPHPQADPRPADLRPTDLHSTDLRPTDLRPTDLHPTGAEPAASEPSGPEPSGPEPTDPEPTGSDPAEPRPTGPRPADSEQADPQSAGPRSTDTESAASERTDPQPLGVPDEHPAASYVLHVNGTDRPVTDAWIGESLLYVLRERLGLAGAKDGCSQGECGACNVQVDGRLVASCLVPAATTAGSEVRTVEGLAVNGEPSDVQRALAKCGAVQCGFCIPGIAMTVHDLLEGNHAPSELETRKALCGNLCRCSGYRGVLDAVNEVIAGREAHAAPVSSDSTSPESDEPHIPHQAAPGAAGVQPLPQDGGMA